MTVIERERVVTELERRARVLEAAALEIEVRGWTKCAFRDDSGAVCLRGGVGFALVNDPEAGWRAECVWNGVDPDPMSDEDFLPLAEFNDSLAESAEEVTFLLRWRAEEIRDGR